jgi:hypothetical protein
MSKHSIARFTAVVLALFVVLATATAPVAATSDDGGLLGDDGDDGDVLGNTTDAVTDTVDSTTDTVSETTGTDAVSDTTDTTDTVDSTVDAVSEPADDTTSTDNLAFDDMPDADSLVGTGDGAGETSGSLVGDEGVADTRNLELDTDQLPAGTAPVPTQDVPTDPVQRGVSTDDLPIGTEDLPLGALPVTGENAPVQPEDAPYGSEGQGNFDACRLPADENDLPLDSVPKPGELGVPAPPGVPLDLLTPKAAAGLVLGLPPRPCEVYDPHDPSVDPTSADQTVEGSARTYVVDANTGRLLYGGGANAQLDQFRQNGDWFVVANDDQLYLSQRSALSDGTTRHYLFVDGDSTVDLQRLEGDGDTRVGVLGRHASVRLDCREPDLANASVNVEDPESSTTCEYTVDGVPSVPVGPETVIGAIEEPPELPGGPEIGDLPANAESLLDL